MLNPLRREFDVTQSTYSTISAIIIVGGSGSCTGAMVNNTAQDGTPYFLTANHCLGGNTNNWSFKFDFESSVFCVLFGAKYVLLKVKYTLCVLFLKKSGTYFLSQFLEKYFLDQKKKNLMKHVLDATFVYNMHFSSF